MGKVVINKSMPLDGYITGPNPTKDQALGEGIRLFNHLSQKQFEGTGVRVENGVTHLTYRLNRSNSHGEA